MRLTSDAIRALHGELPAARVLIDLDPQSRSLDQYPHLRVALRDVHTGLAIRKFRLFHDGTVEYETDS